MPLDISYAKPRIIREKRLLNTERNINNDKKELQMEKDKDLYIK
jgi:hypothetical protein